MRLSGRNAKLIRRAALILGPVINNKRTGSGFEHRLDNLKNHLKLVNKNEKTTFRKLLKVKGVKRRADKTSMPN